MAVLNAGSMSSLDTLREFISERLSVAAAEIFTVFERTIVLYEEEKEKRQYDVTETVTLQGAAGILRENENHQESVCEELQQLCKQEKPEVPAMWKEEEEEVFGSQSASFLPADRGSDNREAETDSEQLLSHCSITDFSSDQQTPPSATDLNVPVLEPLTVWSDSQRSLLDVIWNPQVKLTKLDCPLPHICKENQLCNQEEAATPLLTVDQEEAAPPQIKEEQDEHWSTIEGEQVFVRQQTDKFIEISTCNQRDHKEPQSKLVSPKVKQKTNHTVEKPYSCSDCGKSYSRKTPLIIHKRCHTGEKPYSCSECGNSYRDKYQLVVHKRCHTGERPYSCSQCGKCFRQISAFFVHRKTHTGEKPYSCSECGKSFLQNCYLVNHIRTHTGERPYSCSECDHSFSTQGSLMNHKRTHTGEKRYSCPECDRTFTQWRSYDKHKRTHAGKRS